MVLDYSGEPNGITEVFKSRRNWKKRGVRGRCDWKERYKDAMLLPLKMDKGGLLDTRCCKVKKPSSRKDCNLTKSCFLPNETGLGLLTYRTVIQ